MDAKLDPNIASRRIIAAQSRLEFQLADLLDQARDMLYRIAVLETKIAALKSVPEQDNK